MKESIEKVYKKYNPTKERCRPTVNPNVDATQNRNNLEIACMIADYKNVYFTSNADYSLSKTDKLLKSFIKEKNIKTILYIQYYLSKPAKIENQIIMIPTKEQEKKAIMYTKNGEKNAMLLLLWDMNLNLKEFKYPGIWAESNNPYIIGKLLEYEENDIMFFYQVDGFKNTLKSKKFINITEKNTFIKWPENIKLQFFEFIKNNWSKSESYSIYIRDKKEANKWLNKYSKLSLDQLKATIEKIIIQVNKLAQSYSN